MLFHKPDDWLFNEHDLNNTISRRQGISRMEEDSCRRKGIKVIMKMAGENGLKLKPYPTLATAAVSFHRFYMVHSFREYPLEITSLACVFLAGKVEETPKKCRDICRVAEVHFPDYYQNKHPNLMEEMMGVERVLLQVLSFDLLIDHPYNYIQSYLTAEKIPQEKMREHFQNSWTLTNDSFYTPVCLLWEPQIVAIAMIHLSFIKFGNAKEESMLPNEWWSKYVSNMDLKILEGVYQHVVNFYQLAQENSEKPSEQQQQVPPQNLPPLTQQQPQQRQVSSHQPPGGNYNHYR